MGRNVRSVDIGTLAMGKLELITWYEGMDNLLGMVMDTTRTRESRDSKIFIISE